MKTTPELMAKLNRHFPLYYIYYVPGGDLRLKARRKKAFFISGTIVAGARTTKRLIEEIEVELAIRNVLEAGA